MEKIDPKLAQAVWQRVLQANQPPIPRPMPQPPQPVRPPQPQPRPPMPQPVPPLPVPPPPQPKPLQPTQEELRHWLAETAALERGYRRTNAGRNTPVLRRIAAEEQAQYRQLSALYSRLYGRRPEVLPGAAPGGRSTAADLRALYGAEQSAVQQWREAAARYPRQRDMFERFARDARRHAEQVRQMMRNM